MHLAQTGLLCPGPMAGTEQLFVRRTDRVADRPVPDREAALAELARRCFRGHGPASVPDLARWAAVTLRHALTGLALARDDLLVVE